MESVVDSRGAEASRRVALFDTLSERVKLVTSVIRLCSAEPYYKPYDITRSAGAEPDFDHNQCAIAIGAVCANPSLVVSECQFLQRLIAKGVKVICYGSLHAFSLSCRCRILLTGVEAFLDSGEPDFSNQLQVRLHALLEAEGRRQREEEHIKDLMKEHGLIGESPATISVFRMVLRISGVSDLPVLLLGETGTGKDLLARAIHRLDPKRCGGPFVALNCGALHPSLAESELFGHRRGAYSGADRNRDGLIRTATRGVIFLDESGELDTMLQTKLLRALEERLVLGLGEDIEVPVDVRVVAATNRHIDAMLKQRTFREDLFHRLNTIRICIPPLRERPEDLRPLIRHFLEKHKQLSPFRVKTAEKECIEALGRVTLPGNVRQLENLIRRALVARRKDGSLSLDDLGPEIWQELSQGHPIDPPTASPAVVPSTDHPPPQISNLGSLFESLLTDYKWNLERSMKHCEGLLLDAALRRSRGNQSEAARMLGITTRSVYNKLRKHR